MRTLQIGLFVVFIGVCLFTVYWMFIPKNYSDESLTVGIFPRRNPVMTKNMFTPLTNHLSRELGMRVKLRTAKTFKEFWQGVINREYDMVHFNQYHYILSKANFGYEVIAKNEEQGRSTITGTIVVRKDSDINTVRDLAGKRIVFGGGPKAMESYIYPLYLLQEHGLSPNEYDTHFERNPHSAVVSVYHKLGNYAAAGAGDAILRPVSKHIDFSEMRVLVRGIQHAHLPWAVKSGMSESTKKQIQGVFFELKYTAKGREALRKAKLTNIIPAEDSQYDHHRSIVNAVFNENY